MEKGVLRPHVSWRFPDSKNGITFAMVGMSAIRLAGVQVGLCGDGKWNWLETRR